jgi:acyl-CoA dehydrogenase
MTFNPELRDAVDKQLTQECPPRVVRAAETEGFQARLWSQLAAAGVPWIGTPEANGGSGGRLDDLAEVLMLCGRHAVPLPVAETGLLGSWLLTSAGLDVPQHPVTVPVPQVGDEIRLRRQAGQWVLDCSLASVPWARECTEVILLCRDDAQLPWLVRLPAETATVSHLANLAGEPRDAVSVVDRILPADTVTSLPAGPAIEDDLLLRGALSRTLLAAGAAGRLRDLTLRYATQRVQFGRPIAAFQAVQQSIAIMASESELAGISAVSAIECYLGGDNLGVAAARVAANRAADTARRAAHQIHGAIGMTFEYDLQLYSRRITAWRHEFGNCSYWAERVGRLAREKGLVWPTITG